MRASRFPHTPRAHGHAPARAPGPAAYCSLYVQGTAGGLSGLSALQARAERAAACVCDCESRDSRLRLRATCAPERGWGTQHLPPGPHAMHREIDIIIKRTCT